MRLSKEQKQSAIKQMGKAHLLMLNNGTCFCGEVHPFIHKTMLHSKEWKDWEKVAYKKGFDWAETSELGWMSPEHWSAFVKFIRRG